MPAGDGGGLLGGGGLAARVRGAHRRLALLEVRAALVANGDQLDLDTLALELGDTSLGLLDRVRVVATAQTAVARHHHHSHLLGRARLHERDVERLRACMARR